MLPDDFRDALLERRDEDLIDLCLNEDRTPYVFNDDDAAWENFRESVASKLGSASDRLRVVGSGRLGFSMKPMANLRLFSDTSDIDLVVVDEYKFDDLWEMLLSSAYPRPPINVSGWLRSRQKELYTGWLTPLDIRLDRRIYGPKVDPILSLVHTWFETLKVSSALVVKSHEKINARLYRTWRHAELYHAHSISALRKSIMELG